MSYTIRRYCKIDGVKTPARTEGIFFNLGEAWKAADAANGALARQAAMAEGKTLEQWLEAPRPHVAEWWEPEEWGQ